MTSWILEVEGALNPEQRAVAEGLAAILERLNPSHLDVAGSSVVADTNGFHVTLLHSNRPELRVDVNASGGGEIIVSYGEEHEHFRSEDAEAGRVWPFPSEDHIQASLALVECLLTGRIELQVWKRPLGVKTRSYWINEDGQADLFLRGGTAGPYFGWSRTPEIYRFDNTRPLRDADIGHVAAVRYLTPEWVIGAGSTARNTRRGTDGIESKPEL